MAIGESPGDPLRPIQPGSAAARLSPRSPLYKFEAPLSDQLTRHHGDPQQGEIPWEQRKSSLQGAGVQPGSRIQEVWILLLYPIHLYFLGLHEKYLSLSGTWQVSTF
jgi:hypothetical protein